MASTYDVVIIGAGATGLSLAASLGDTELKVLVVDQSSLAPIQTPKPDNREIALTHASIKLLQQFDIWRRLVNTECHAIQYAKVFNGNDKHALTFNAKSSVLGYLVPHYLIKQVLYEKVCTCMNVEVLTEHALSDIKHHKHYGELRLNDKTIHAKLVVGADGRRSRLRQMLNISAHTKVFNKTMIISRFTHEKPNHKTAYEYFLYGKTLALLPLGDKQSSVVLTINDAQIDEITSLSDNEYASYIAKILDHAFGDMQQICKQHHYPLHGLLADTFIAQRCALIGDAAVGMHPVTAHGFNLGLRAQAILATEIKNALAKDEDIGSRHVLRAYLAQQLLFARVMYYGTNSIVRLFTNDSAPARNLRHIALRFSANFPPLKYAITQQLTQNDRRLSLL